jgi:phage shock protein A
MSNETETTNGFDALKEYDVIVTETLTKTVRVAASGVIEAEQAVRDNWRNGIIELDSGNFFDVEFHAGDKNPDLLLDPIDTEITDSIDTTFPLNENEHVKGLLDKLKQYDRDTSGLTSLLSYVSEMEGFVKRMEGNISSMKTQLDSIKDAQNQPFRNYLSNTIAALEEKVASLKEHIGNIRTQIIEGCKKALSAIRETGISALGNFMSFLNVKRDMELWSKNIDNTINANNKSVSKIEAFTKQYHAAGSHIKNMARVTVGKEPLTTVKEAGKLSKAVATPYLQHNRILKNVKTSVDKAISKLESMEEKQAEKKAERELEKKPSLLEKLAKNKSRVEQVKLNTPVLERAKAHGVEV